MIRPDLRHDGSGTAITGNLANLSRERMSIRLDDLSRDRLEAGTRPSRGHPGGGEARTQTGRPRPGGPPPARGSQRQQRPEADTTVGGWKLASASVDGQPRAYTVTRISWVPPGVRRIAGGPSPGETVTDCQVPTPLPPAADVGGGYDKVWLLAGVSVMRSTRRPRLSRDRGSRLTRCPRLGRSGEVKSSDRPWFGWTLRCRVWFSDTSRGCPWVTKSVPDLPIIRGPDMAVPVFGGLSVGEQNRTANQP